MFESSSLIRLASWSVLVVSVASAQPTSALELSPCTLPGLSLPALCGWFEVPEDRSAPASPGRRTIKLRVAVVPALEPPALPDPIVYISGGPGEGSIGAAPGLAEAYAELHKKRDFLLVDLRGTGESTPLLCDGTETRKGVQAFLDEFLPSAMVRACRAKYAAQTDFSRYTTDASIDDLNDIRAALGYQKLNLIGGSYGTRAVQVYLRRHGEHARTATLFGVVPTGLRLPLDVAKDAHQALLGTFDECAGDPECHAAFPDLRGDLAKVLARLDKEPARVPLADPSTGAVTDLVLTRDGFAQALRYMLYGPTSAVQVPLYVHLAAQGNFQPIAETAQIFSGFLSSGADGIYLSITCSEDVPFFSEAEAAQAVRDTFLGDFRIRQQKAACAEWRVPPVDKSFLEPVTSNVPTLLVSGERDPVTPPAYGDQVARTLSNSRHLVVADGAHEFGGMKNADCVDRISADFIASARLDAQGLDTSCLASIARPPFQLKLPAAAVALPRDQEDRLIGHYANATISLEVLRLGGTLQMRLGDQPTPLRALSPLEFGFVGLPPTMKAAFIQDGGSIVGVVIDSGSGDPVRLERQK